MKILMINQPIGNRGDESAHKGLVRKILSEFENVQITVLFCGDIQHSVDQFNVNDPRVEYVNIKPAKAFGSTYKKCLLKGHYLLWHIHPTVRKIKSYYKDCDFVLNAPGGICMGGFQAWIHLFFLKMAFICNKKVVYYGRSFGPFPTRTPENRRFKELSMEFLQSFSFLSIRDQKTEKLARELSIDYIPTVDSAFLDNTHVAVPSALSDLINGERYMIFVPNLLVWHYAYKDITDKKTVLDFYSGIIDIIRSKFGNIKILMLPQLFDSPLNDIIFFKELKTCHPDENMFVIDDTYSSDIQQALIKDATFVIGARYHSIVFSINQATPFIALSYEHKISGLLESLNKEDRIIDISTIWSSEEDIKKCLHSVSDKLSDLQSDEALQRKAKDKANACFALFSDFVKKQEK